MSRKRIKSKRKSENLAKYIMGGTVIFLMFASLFGIYLSSMNSTNNVLTYNGFKLSIDQNTKLIYYDTGDEKVYFYNLPSDIDNLEVPSNLVAQFNSANFVVFTFNPNATSQLPYYDELRYRFPKIIPAGVGVINNTGDYKDYPIATCDNSTYEVPVLYLKYNPLKSEIYNSDSCIVLEGSGRSFLNFRDYLVYSKLGIINKTKSN